MAFLRAVVRLLALVGPPALVTTLIAWLYGLRLPTTAMTFGAALLIWIEAVRGLNRD